MPLRKTSSGWMWGSKHFKTKADAIAARTAAYANGYKGERMVTYKIGEQPEEEDLLTELVMDLLHSATITHIMHWQTTSYAQHVALGEFYSEIPELIDAVIEAYQGKNNVILNKYPVETESYEDLTPLNYLEYLNQELYEGRGMFGDDSEIQNLVDSIAELIDSTIYKLRRFK
jgi:DNA-binding ferritin-like protein